MTERITREWWVCLCDEHGNVQHKPVGEFLRENREALLKGSVPGQRAIALAHSLEASQLAGRLVKQELRADMKPARTGDSTG